MHQGLKNTDGYPIVHVYNNYWSGGKVLVSGHYMTCMLHADCRTWYMGCIIAVYDTMV